MKIKIRLLAIVFLCNHLVFTSCSQNSPLPFHDEIQAFKAQDKASPPPKNAILFVGSSSFKMWADVAAYFPRYTIINRGFGGSGLNDVIRYADKIIIPYNPKQIVIYCGENDIAGSLTSTDVLQRFTKLFNIVRRKLPATPIVFISIKPSPSREKFIAVIEDSNIKIRQFLDGQPNTVFLDVFHAMLGKDGLPRKELFLEDMLHMNPQGYALWKTAIEPVLLK